MNGNLIDILFSGTGKRVLWIAGSFVLALLIRQGAPWLASRLVRLAVRSRAGTCWRVERQATLRSLYASTLTVLAFAGAFLVSLGQFVTLDTLVWMVGLFSAAFGLAARPMISDLMAGISFLFEDAFSVGEKVEMLDKEGIVEAINLRATWLRSPTGELYVVPNGDIRLVRNFSRGHFSPADVRLHVPATDLNRAFDLLRDLGNEAVFLLPNLLEPWQVISEEGTIGQQVQLTVLAKAKFGKAAEMRPRLLALVHARLADAGINTGE